MASNSVRNALAVFNLAYEIPNTIVNSYKETTPKTIIKYRDEIHRRCDICIDLYLIDQLSGKELKQIQNRLSKMNEVTMSDEVTISTLTSIVLALLDDLLSFQSSKRRKKKQEVIEHLLKKYQRLHRHFDRHLSKYEDYKLAEKAVHLFYQEEES